MGRQAFLVVISWLTLSVSFGEKSPVQSSAILDNESAESAPRLYRGAPLGGYASAAPYGAYSFQLPTYVAGPFAAASQPVPVKHGALVISNGNGYLKDSYGNRFVETPQNLGYKTAFPQQFLPLQKLPEHLAQPLVGASPNFQFKETSPQVFVGSPYRIPALQGPTSTPVGQFAGYSQPLVYAQNVRTLAPASGNQKAPNAQQQSTNNKAVFVNKQADDYYGGGPTYQRIQEIYGEPKFQRIQEIPRLPYRETKFQRIQESPYRFPEYKYERYGESPQNREQSQKATHTDSATLQAVPAKKTVTYVNDLNGKTTVVKLETQPPIPLLDLTLLEPLTFENPLVPQVQHFLPRIHQATYQKLPQELFKTPKKASEPSVKPKPKVIPKNTVVTHHETLDEAPEISYEINQPNYKETYKEQAVSYNKETAPPPVTITYGSKTENEPVTYSYSRSSEDPPQNQELRYDNDEPAPLVYTLSPSEQKGEVEDVESHSSEDESESLRGAPKESDDSNSYHERAKGYKERPESNQYHHEPRNGGNYQQHSAEYNERPIHHDEPRHQSSYQQNSEEYKESPKSNQQHESRNVEAHDRQPEEYKETPKSNHYHEPRHNGPYRQNSEEYKENPRPNQQHELREDVPYNRNTKEYKETPTSRHHELREEVPYNRNTEEYKETPTSSHHELREEVPYNQNTEEYKKSPKSSHHELREEVPYNRNTEEYKGSPKSSHHELREEIPYNRNTEEYKGSPKSSHHQETQNNRPYSQNSEHYKERPKSNHHERNQDHHHKSNQELPSEVKQNPQKFYSQPTQLTAQNYEEIEPITHQYEEDIRILPTASAIKVDPNQHIQYTKSTQQPYSSQSSPPRHEDSHRHHPSSDTHQGHHSSGPNNYQDYSAAQPEPRNAPPPHQQYSAAQPDRHQAPHILEKSKRIIIKEETPESMHMLTEKMRQETIQREENSEEDFEKAYKDAAFGFPAYSEAAKQSEKSIFDPASYGVPPEHIEYDIEHIPFQQYQEEGDEYPKAVRSNYKDARDKNKDDYYSGYKVSTPERLNDRYRNKNDYYQVYRNNKPAYLDSGEVTDGKKKPQKSAKYTAAPSHEYPPQKAQSYYAPYKPKQKLYEYDYSRGPTRDNSAFASIPLQRYRLKTNFVEPQYQYGFEPVSIPKLLDSELAAMASNLSPESEKPGMRKKIYKENWYIKQTSMSAGDPAS